MINEDLYIRQTGLVHPETLSKSIAVIGAGGIGSWTVLALLKMGCQDIKVFDMDHVEVHNAASQVYTSLDAGKTKIQALADRLFDLTDLSPSCIEAEITPDNAKEFLKGFDIVISAVDSIEVRKTLFKALEGTNIVFIDGRMAGNAIEIYTIPMNDTEKRTLYSETLFGNEEALDIPCSERSVVYNCFVISGLITAMVGHICNNRPVPTETIVDLMNFTMFN